MSVALRGSEDDTIPTQKSGPKILTIDIETSPSLAYVWKIWDENIGINQLVDVTETLCFSAKWYGQKKTMFFSSYEHGPETMVKEAYELIDQADIIIHWNGKRFDMPHLSREFLLAQMTPPSPVQQIDLMQVVRQRFKFTSNKLDFVAQQLGVGSKIHKGVDFTLWKGCMDGDPEAWKTMEKYNRQDVVITEKVFDKIKPWLGGLMNVGLFTGDSFACNICGSESLQRRGFKYKKKTIVQQYACMDCGAWATDDRALAKTTTSGII